MSRLFSVATLPHPSTNVAHTPSARVNEAIYAPNKNKHIFVTRTKGFYRSPIVFEAGFSAHRRMCDVRSGRDVSFPAKKKGVSAHCALWICTLPLAQSASLTHLSQVTALEEICTPIYVRIVQILVRNKWFVIHGLAWGGWDTGFSCTGCIQFAHRFKYSDAMVSQIYTENFAEPRQPFNDLTPTLWLILQSVHFRGNPVTYRSECDKAKVFSFYSEIRTKNMETREKVASIKLITCRSGYDGKTGTDGGRKENR